jgi:hypothetical protein
MQPNGKCRSRSPFRQPARAYSARLNCYAPQQPYTIVGLRLGGCARVARSNAYAQSATLA